MAVMAAIPLMGSSRGVVWIAIRLGRGGVCGIDDIGYIDSRNIVGYKLGKWLVTNGDSSQPGTRVRVLREMDYREDDS